MGPDCGTAIINGIPLGFANVVRRGDIGLVAASGTGLQEVTCRIHNLGAGVSQAIGTGGRDLRDEIGGTHDAAALRALADDDQTRVIVLISKPPSPTVASRILALAAASGKPTVVHFLGAAPGTVQGASLHRGPIIGGRRGHRGGAAAGARARACIVDTAERIRAPMMRTCSTASQARSAPSADSLPAGRSATRRSSRSSRAGLPCRSNAPVHGALPLDGSTADHVFIDMGDDEYTRGRPHPMIDPSLRNAAIRDAADDPAVAMTPARPRARLRVASEPGATSSPTRCGTPSARRALKGRKLASIGHVCGTDGDPQDRAAQIRTLASAGAIVADSNIEAASLAAQLALHLAQRPAARTR